MRRTYCRDDDSNRSPLQITRQNDNWSFFQKKVINQYTNRDDSSEIALKLNTWATK